MNRDDIGRDLTNKWVEIKGRDEIADCIQLGDLLTIHGKIRIFRGNRQITCQSTSKNTYLLYKADLNK